MLFEIYFGFFVGERFYLPMFIVGEILRKVLGTKFEILPKSLCFRASIFENPISKNCFYEMWAFLLWQTK